MQCVAQSTPMVAASFGLLRRRALVAQLRLVAARVRQLQPRPWRRAARLASITER